MMERQMENGRGVLAACSQVTSAGRQILGALFVSLVLWGLIALLASRFLF